MVPESSKQTYFDVSSLPDTSIAEVDFVETSFFHSHALASPQLPTPANVLKENPDLEEGVAIYKKLNLAIKFGGPSYLRLEEAQTMRAVKRAFPNNEVPVPEVFGWSKYRDKCF
ncbi:uncharacterized protein BCR38DRAFT_416435 [Pseudomassariella vexata]|uniref:Uncharacterized protein n=1 Tax=Pseudomassariella vexata TaxID=1141098 RepID=A0A1Y2EIA0_9PEZI|nr:uncharacterized protein BCR38DRAFT_416435 [Pseudomassariella vexata]ORY71312.1 hypothetical protein BCR38DRAFT_416435 [Pseudomassariella vexata]